MKMEQKQAGYCPMLVAQNNYTQHYGVLW